MTLEIPEKPKPESAKAVELAERVRNAAALKYATNLTDARHAGAGSSESTISNKRLLFPPPA